MEEEKYGAGNQSIEAVDGRFGEWQFTSLVWLTVAKLGQSFSHLG